MIRACIAVSLALILFGALPSIAQTGSPKTPAALATEINTFWADNMAGGMTLPNARQTLLDIIASYANIAPAGNQPWSAVGVSPLNLYASTTGNDTNNNCTGSANPCTLRNACVARSQIATFLTAAMTINVAGGTYSTPDGNGALCSIEGNFGGSATALTNIVGDCSNASNVVLSIPDGDTGIFTKDLGETEISCLKFQGAGSGVVIGVSGAQFSVADLQKTVWGAFGAGSVGLQIGQNASFNLLGTAAATINGNIGTFISVLSGGLIGANGSTTIAIPSAVAWGGQFIQLYEGGSATLGGMTFTGSGVAGTTGKRATLIGPVYLVTAGIACNTVFPGNSSCTLVGGAQDDANDAMSYGGTIDFPDGGLWGSGGIDSARILSGSVVLASTGLGYQTGAGFGGTVTQATNKSTAVTLNTATGQITMNNAALGAGTIVSFTLTDSTIAATDVLSLNHISGGTIGSYSLNAQAAAGSATINVRNNTGGSLSEAIVIQFALIKGSNN